MENLRDPMTLPDYHFTSNKHRNSFVDYYNTAVEAGHTAFVEDVVPVAPSFKKFYDEMKHKNPTMTFTTTRGAGWRIRTGDDTGYYVYGRLGIIYEDAPDVVVGVLGVEISSNRETVYVVQSERIRNDRYAAHNSDYNIKRSKNFKTAVKTANTYLQPTNIRAIHNECVRSLDRGLDQIKMPAANKIHQATDLPTRYVIDEIKAMITAGYTPKTGKFLEAYNLLKTEGAELERISSYKPPAVFVWIKANKMEYIDAEGGIQTANTLEDVPEDIRNKIAVLQIGAADSAIMDVGVKVDDTKYWVFQ